MWFRKQQYPCQPGCLAPKRRRNAISLPSPQYLYIPHIPRSAPPTGERPRFQEMLREGMGPGRPFDIVLVLDDTRLPRLGDDFDRYGDQLRLDPVETWTVR